VKVLLATGIFPPDIGGPATYVPKLAMDLVALGHKVSIVTLGSGDSVDILKQYKVRRINRETWFPLRILKTAFHIFLESRECQSIFSNGLFIESALALKFSKKKNSVVKIVGDPIWERLRNRGLTTVTLEDFLSQRLGLKQTILRKVFNWSWSKFDYRIAPSLELCTLVNRNLKSDSCIHIPNGVEKQEEPSKSTSENLITVSRLVNWKNLDIVVKAAAISKVRLTIVGSGPEENNLRDLALSVNADVQFLGQLDSIGTLNAMRSAKYFVQVSDYEGLSFSLLEAMSLGLIPIVSKVPGNTSVISHMVNGLVISPSKNELVNAINELMADDVLCKRISLQAISDVSSRFDGTKLRAKVIDMLT
jgi:glycosyltransferase involved in cell wall biosynthesis